MRNSRKKLLAIVSVISLCLPLSAFVFGGGPLVVLEGGMISRWSVKTISLRLDQGGLGALSDLQIRELLLAAVNEWGIDSSANREISAIRFSLGQSLNEDLNGSKIQTQPNLDAEISKLSPGEALVILDADGSITENLIGEGAEDVLGFASPAIDPQTGDLVKGFAVLNGANSGGVNFRTQLTRTVIHEIGHLIGLDHTQIGFDFPFADGKLRPIMFPFLGSIAPDRPIRDDIAWVSRLYPTATSLQTTATITGQVFRNRVGGSSMQGANVVAVMLNGDGSESKAERVSVVSDFLGRNDGSFEIPGLTPGNYGLFIEPIAEVIVEAGEGSSIGPFDPRAVFRAFEKDYFNGPNESGDVSDDPLERDTIPLQPGGSASQINMVTNELCNTLSLLGDDDQNCFVFEEVQEGFRFPFFGATYTQVFVNSDGNLTFGIGDARPDGAPRTESRFIDGPPRIAPLFSDLDPSAIDAEIRAETGDGFIKFIWDNVPEFGGDLAPQRNSFSVTLYSNGDILFDFEEVNVTPDDDLQAIVGITPGGGISGASQNLSAGTFKHKIGNAPIFQVFLGTSFNLTGQRIFFQASQQRLIFPFFRSDPFTFTGFAINNLSEQAAVLTFELFRPDGNLIPLPNNPSFQEIQGGAQLAMTGREIFNFQPLQGEEVIGWVRVSSDEAVELAGFFQFGNGLGGSELTRMDGSVAFKQPSQTLFFTRIFHGPAAFFAFQEGLNNRATTFLSVANPNEEPIELTLTLYNAMGQSVVPPVSISLFANGFLFKSLNDIFEALPLDDNRMEGFVKVEVVEGPGAVGFQLIELPDSLLGLNAQTDNSGDRLFSAQLGEGDDVFTDLNLVNTTDSPRLVSATAFLVMDDGSVQPKDSQVLHNTNLNQNQSIPSNRRRAFEIFGFTQQDPRLNVGSIVVKVDGGDGIIGDVVFGDPDNAEFVAALPLESRPFKRAVFSQIADGPRSLDPSLQSFTGLAIFNPNSVEATVQIEVFDKDGNSVGKATKVLPPGGRLSQQVIELSDELKVNAVNLVGGSIFLLSDQPIVAQELFGNLTLKFLSSVPPTILE